VTLPETTCARCGVVILPGAPRHERTDMTGKSWRFEQFHPGCWAAEQRQTTTTTGSA